MENFKLDLTQLTHVEEKDRIKGNWYVVADYLNDDTPPILQFKERNLDTGSSNWKYWLQIPPNLPGFPKSELPDEFELKAGEWDYYNKWTRCWEKSKGAKYRRNKQLPELTIPSGTKEDQIEAVRKILEELETK
jgi:hypothetical protein